MSIKDRILYIIAFALLGFNFICEFVEVAPIIKISAQWITIFYIVVYLITFGRRKK